jgi:hypothetical protein
MLHARIPVARLPGATALYRDYAAGAEAPIHRWLERFDAESPVWSASRSRPARADSALVRELVRYNEGLGLDAALRSRLGALADGSVRAVVTGQQPGVLGGPLLTMYKIATAVALAREIEARWRVPCVPVFWLGCDDDDFAEVRDLSVLTPDLARLDVSVDASAFRPGLRVGDIAADAVRSAWAAVASLVPPGTGADGLGRAAALARDFGHAAALGVVAATQGQVAVVDGRDPALRAAGRDLLLSFFDREHELRAATDALGRELSAAGYHAQLSSSADSGLFLVRDGVRGRVPPPRRESARAEFAADIARVSPGVVARNLLQDAVLTPIAVVLGPAEIAYRAQLSGVYRAMDVPVPAVVPRLSATFLPAPVLEMAKGLGLKVETSALEPLEAARAARAAAEDVAFKSAARSFEAAFAREARAFEALSRDRLDARARERLERRLQEIGARLGQALADAVEQDALGAEARWPFLARFTELFRKDAAAQERFLSLHVPMLLHGEAGWPACEAMAAEFVRDALDRRVWHGVYSVP